MNLSLRVDRIGDRGEGIDVKDVVMMVKESVCKTTGKRVEFKEKWYD